MKKPARKRAPQGATSLMVLDALVRLHTKYGRRASVSRADLLLAVRLPETTVDDRLRTLVKQGRVSRVGRALYVPTPWPGQEPRCFELPTKMSRAARPLPMSKTTMPDGSVVIRVGEPRKSR